MTSLNSSEAQRAPLAPASPHRNHPILLDTHVHIYDCFDINRFLEAAWQNFHRQAGHDRFTGILLLTESGDYQRFQTLLAQAAAPPPQGWWFAPTAEAHSLRATDRQGKTLYLIAGRQIITAEKLEVLALMCDRTDPDGQSAAATIHAIQTAGGIAVLPWGVGKWLGKRGQLVTQLLQQPDLAPLFLGDNSGRPQFWRRPSHFAQAEQLGRPILLGTDPLPLATEVCRPGKFGLMLTGEFDREQPGRSVKTHLLNPAASWQPYGRLETPWQFVRNQTALRGKPHLSPQPPISPEIATPMAPAPESFPEGFPESFPETADIETSSEDYATRFTGAIGAWLLQVQAEATLQMLTAHPGAKVLDVGGGHGQLTQVLIERGYDVTVLGSAEVCRARIQAHIDQGQCAFQVGNVLAMPYADNAFDVVISYRFLAHVSQWQAFLTELTRVARQAVMVDYPTVRSVNAIAPALFKFKKGLEGNTRPFVCYPERDITHFCQAIGWSQAQRYAQFFWPMVLHRTLGQPAISATLEQVPRLLGLTRLLGSPVIAKFQKL